MTNFCIICNKIFENSICASYNKCVACGSYIYISDSSAADLNKEFYNNLQISKYNVDILKKNIFYFYKSLDKLKRGTAYKEFDAKHAVVLETIRDRHKIILEIGFGTGENLVNLLDAGADAYGIDISEANVANFVNKHPQYAGRVSCSTRIDKTVDIVYTSALFEHLDSPQDFIDNINSSISDRGIVILDNIPLANDNIHNISPDSDICFWNGIHKAVYTKQAIIDYAARNGYESFACGDFDHFTYRVLSAHKYYGYNVIEDIRHPFMSGERLPTIWSFAKICKLAVRMNSPALLGFVVLKKAV